MPTHLNLPDQVLTLWSFSLTARQLLLVLVGGGLSGDLWHLLARLGSVAVVGQTIRLLLTLVPLLITLVVAWYQHAGRYLEVWCIVVWRYLVRPHRFVWRTLRSTVQPCSSHVPHPADKESQIRAGRAETYLTTKVVPNDVAAPEVA